MGFDAADEVGAAGVVRVEVGRRVVGVEVVEAMVVVVNEVVVGRVVEGVGLVVVRVCPAGVA